MSEPFRFHAEWQIWSDRYALRIARGKQMVSEIVMVDRDAGDFLPPAMIMSQDEMQQLADTLWSAGIRPTQGRNSEGVVSAQSRHLEDMRALVFAKLNVQQPTQGTK